MKKIVIASLATSALLFATTASFAADLGAEISTAATHAGLAAKAGTIDDVHMHLHHAVNCLVGPNGQGFDAKQMNPCANSGNGAIPDSTDAAQKTKLMTAVGQANHGIAETNLAAAQADATATQATIAGAK